MFNYLNVKYFSFLDMLGLVIRHFWWKEYFSRTPVSYMYTNSIEFVVLAIEKIGDWEKLEILVKNQSFWNIVGDLLQAPRNSKRDNAAGIIVVWWTCPPLILQIHSLHQIATGTPSRVPPRRRGIIIAIFHDFGTNCMVR